MEKTIVIETAEYKEKEASVAEVCFGALLGVGAIAGMWGVVSLIIRMVLEV